MNVLSLFDGISCGKVALERAGIPVAVYYASEVDENAIAISKKHHPDIVQLGDVTRWREWDIPWECIDLLIGGSPCQGFSSAGKSLNFNDPRSKLFFVYVEILDHIRTVNPAVKFLLENVKMKTEWQDVITEHLGVQPIDINSKLLSGQNRPRIYWTNVENVKPPRDKNIFVADILEDIEQEETVGMFKKCIRDNVVAQYHEIVASDKEIHKLRCKSGWQDNKVGILKSPALRYGNSFCLVKTKDNKVRQITITEAERLQTLPDGYTRAEGIALSRRFAALGNGWTVDVIAHIFSHLPEAVR